MEAARIQREQQQGLGNPIVAEQFHGTRFVAVGGRLYQSPSWKTFHDFLFFYIKQMMGKEWYEEQNRLLPDIPHPLFKVMMRFQKWQMTLEPRSGEVKSTPMTGATSVLLRFAYHLYVINHNNQLPEAVLTRLRNPKQFEGAQHEIYVAATFIKAGFKIEFEDESVSTTAHPELTATYQQTGAKYVVEAKAKSLDKESDQIGSPLFKAISKSLIGTRIIWIATNSTTPDQQALLKLLTGIQEQLADSERRLTVKGQKPPPAYVIVSNRPDFLSLDTEGVLFGAVTDGFHIPDFKFGKAYSSFREYRLARDRHKEIHALLKSMREHDDVPATFDGSTAEVAFGSEEVPRLQIGNYYELPMENGEMGLGKLVEASVGGNLVYGIYEMTDRQKLIFTNSLTPEEVIAYARHPETFFGVYKRNEGKNLTDPLDLYDSLYASLKDYPMEGLLRQLMGHPDLETLKKLPREELAMIVCDRQVEWVMREQKPPVP